MSWTLHCQVTRQYREHIISPKGVTASKKMAEEDLESMKKYKNIIKSVAERRHVNPALIAGIISRESEAGHSIKNTDPPGWGDNYNAFGLMQVRSLHLH